MPISLPPPIPPQQAEVGILEARHEQAQAKGNVIVLDSGKYQLLVSGNSYLKKKKIKSVTRKGNNPSAKVLLLNALYLSKGHILVNIQYARDGRIIYVQVNEGVLKRIDGPPVPKAFFAKFKGVQDLTKSQLAPELVLAERRAMRAGYKVSLHYSVDPLHPSSYTLDIDTQPDPSHKSVDSILTFGNPGNRFLGRYFGLAHVNIKSPTGDVYGINYAHGFINLGTPRGGDAYNSVQLSYSRVNPFGMFGVSGSYSHYKFHNQFPTIPDDHIKATTYEGALTGSQILLTQPGSRLVLQEKAGYVDAKRTLTKASGLPIGLRLLDEHFAFAQLGVAGNRAWQFLGRRGNLSGHVDYVRGFAGSVDNFLAFADRRTAHFNVFQGELKAAYSLPRNLTVNMNLRGQLSPGDRLPLHQQFVLGGPASLRAWLPGILVGDTGAYANLNLELPRWHVLGMPLRFTFYIEGGMANYEDVSSGVPRILRQTRSAADGGAKLEIQLLDSISAVFYAALPIADHNLGDRAHDARSDAYFTLIAKW